MQLYILFSTEFYCWYNYRLVTSKFLDNLVQFSLVRIVYSFNINLQYFVP